MAGVAFDTLQNKQNELIRRTIDGSVFLAPITASAITTLTDTDKLLRALPVGYEDVGWIDDSGAVFARSVDTANATSFGAVEPTRSDITKDTTTVKIICQETKRATIGLYSGADMTGITADATTSEVDIAKPARPAFQHYRCLILGVDLTDAGELYIARFLPRVRVTDYDDQKFQSKADDPLTFGVTLTAYIDSTLGYSSRDLYGGQGWAALKTQMGF
ncbi:hypothetical protein NE236_41340 [Actinoallomurus purpureus]|uniref:phage tail tube protein n=1 Tax=Actinoallomurus purpureus TaxID=478114 RepID=UPI0020934E63|nr:hypothetical protein [Actinoallomurus purpureus]MCO6011414.1 hypothetical protein [Actinoallomurus purpureus]